MATTQSAEDILELLSRLVGESVSHLQVLGVNSLKSVAPSPDALVNRTITRVSVSDRTLAIECGGLAVLVDLQRTGKLRWLDQAEPAKVGSSSFPTIRLLLGSGAGLDFSEPAKTKRISVRLQAM